MSLFGRSRRDAAAASPPGVDFAALRSAVAERCRDWRLDARGIPSRPSTADKMFIRGRLGRLGNAQWLAQELAELERLWALEVRSGRGGAVGVVSFDHDDGGGGLLERFDAAMRRRFGR